MKDNSPTNQLAISQVANWSIRVLDDSQLVISPNITFGAIIYSKFYHFTIFRQTILASWLVHESSSPQVIQSTRWPVRQFRGLDWLLVGLSVNCPLNSIGGDPPLWLYRMLKHCFLQRGISSTPTLNADWCQPLAYVCARPKVINKKEYHFSQ